LALLNANRYSPAKEVQRTARVFAEHRNFIYAVIRSKVKDDTQADDLLQDFFLSLISKPPPEGVKNLKSYLYRAITNDMVDAARRLQNYQARMHRYAEHLRYTTGNGDPEKALIGVEEMNRTFELIEQRLRHSEAEAIILRYKDNSSIKEVAEKMGVNSRSVSKYIYKGLKKIRQFLTIK
jgi:RNA polymerase sigma-70 factor (ECF subfamily)